MTATLSRPHRVVVASAPGKLILLGEHAVVYGHPCLVSSVDLRLEVELAAAPDDEIHLQLPELGEDGRTSWPDLERLTRVAREAWEASRDERCSTVPPTRREVTPSQLVQLALGEAAHALPGAPRGGLRVRVGSALPVGAGFGSSAALAATVVAAFFAWHGASQDLEELFRVSLEVERRQHGSPSGVDNSAVLWGGLLWAERRDGQLRCEPVASKSPLLGQLRVYHSGAPGQSTGQVVAGVRAARNRDPERIDAAFAGLAAATRELRDELESADLHPGRILRLLRSSHSDLEALGVVPTATAEVIRRIEAAGGAAKISGAGSSQGDGAGCVLVFHPQPERLDALPSLEAWSHLRVGLGGDGLRVRGAEG